MAIVKVLVPVEIISRKSFVIFIVSILEELAWGILGALKGASWPHLSWPLPSSLFLLPHICP